MASSELGSAFEGVSPPYASASSSKQPWDVFINHCGIDVKHTFAAKIYDTLCCTGLRVFLDVEAIEAGDVISTEIQEAMCSVCLHIAIFSANYARSPRCLAELSFMLKTEAKIIPVFYYVDPSHLHWVAQGKGSYASAFSNYEENGRYTSEKLQEWKIALEKVSMHSGLVINDNYDEGKALKDIENKVFRAMKKVPLEVAKHPVGLDFMVQELWERCTLQSESNVQIVGIVGAEGVGKTTLAKELYNQKYSSFRNTSFIFDVRVAASKSAVHKKQKKLLKDIGVKNQDLIFDNIEEGKAILASRLRSLSVLIVLDDVDHEDQLDALLPERDHLGSPSLIIVTSRESGVLKKWGISSNAIHKMKRLNQSHAEQLFCWHAFLQPYPKEGFEDLVRKYLIDCGHLPLSLKECGEQISKEGNASDIEWERKLPPRYHKILSRDVAKKNYSSKKEIYVALCNSIQIDEGKQSVWLDQSTGKICLKTSARCFDITWGHDDKHWRWVSTEESRFGQVIELVEVCFFHIYHRLECILLSPNTEYTVAFVIKIDQRRMHSHQSPFEFSLETIEGNLIKSARFLDDLERSVESHGGFNMTPLKYAENGWIEFVVGEFFLKEDDGSGQARVVDVFMKNKNCNFKKRGIFLDGVKITPKIINKCGEQVYKKSNVGNDCPRSKAAGIANSYILSRTDDASDLEWARKLPPNYHKILSKAVVQKDYSSMQEIYAALCNSIQIEKGKQIVWLDQSTGKIGLKASARSMAITWGEDDRYWRWVSTEETRFGQVIELIEVWLFHVYHRFECTLLSPNTEYTVAFVVKIDKSRMRSYQSPFEFSLETTDGNLIQSARFLDDLEKPVESHGGFNMTPLKYAENGWMEFVVGEFFLKEDDGSGRARVIDVHIKNKNTNFRKSGIFLDGVKITPK